MIRGSLRNAHVWSPIDYWLRTLSRVKKTDSGEVGSRPLLYSFRRCPYAIRARLALAVSELEYEVREVVLRDKPEEMLVLSPKGTVPVLLDGPIVIDESLDILKWCLAQHDPQGWLRFSPVELTKMAALVNDCDSAFKTHLDRYKYSDRFSEHPPEFYRSLCLPFISELNRRLSCTSNLFADRLCYADIAIFPFIRQFANVDPDWFAGQNYPGLQRWLAQLLESDLFKSVMSKYPQWRPGDKALVVCAG